MKTILLLEDDPFIANIYTTILESKGFALELVATTAELMHKIKSDKPVLIMLDIMMPHQNGMEVLEKLCINPDTAHIPVVIVSSLDDYVKKQKALSLGAKAWFVKVDMEPTVLIDKALALIKK